MFHIYNLMEKSHNASNKKSCVWNAQQENSIFSKEDFSWYILQ